MITKFKIFEDTNPKTLTMDQIQIGECPNCGHKNEIDISKFVDKDSIEGTCVGCGEKKFKYNSNIKKWRWT